MVQSRSPNTFSSWCFYRSTHVSSSVSFPNLKVENWRRAKEANVLENCGYRPKLVRSNRIVADSMPDLLNRQMPTSKRPTMLSLRNYSKVKNLSLTKTSSIRKSRWGRISGLTSSTPLSPTSKVVSPWSASLRLTCQTWRARIRIYTGATLKKSANLLEITILGSIFTSSLHSNTSGKIRTHLRPNWPNIASSTMIAILILFQKPSVNQITAERTRSLSMSKLPAFCSASLTQMKVVSSSLRNSTYSIVCFLVNQGMKRPKRTLKFCLTNSVPLLEACSVLSLKVFSESKATYI